MRVPGGLGDPAVTWPTRRYERDKVLTRCRAVDPEADQCVLTEGHYQPGGFGLLMSLHEVCPYCSDQIEDPAGKLIPCSYPDCARWHLDSWSCHNHSE